MDSNNSLIPDPETSTESDSLVPDSAVVESGKTEPEAAPAPAKDYSLPPEPAAPAEDLPTAGAIKNDTDEKPKKKVNFKLIGIIAGIVVVVAALVLVFIFVILPIIEKNSRGSLNTDAKAMVIQETLSGDSKYAIFDENGKPITDFIYSSATEFANGYSVVSDTAGDKVGIITSGGKMSIDFGTYATINRYGNVFGAVMDNGQRKLIRGNNELIAEYSGEINYYDDLEMSVVKVDGKYRLYDKNGEKKYEFDNEPTIEPILKGDKTYWVKASNHVVIIDTIFNRVVLDQDITRDYDSFSVSSDGKCAILRHEGQTEDHKRAYGILYRGNFKEVAFDDYLYIGSDISDNYAEDTSCYIYSDSRTGVNDYNLHPNFKILDEEFKLVARPYSASAIGASRSNSYYFLDAKHHIQTIDDKTSKRKYIEFYVDGQKVKEVNNHYRVKPIDSEHYAVEYYESNSYKYCLFNTSGDELECNTDHGYYSVDVYGAIPGDYVFYDKEYNKIADFENIYANLPYFDDETNNGHINGYYLLSYNSDKFVFLVDPKTGKELIKRDLYKKIEYQKQYDTYLATRDDDSIDIIDKDFNVLSTIVGKVTLHQNYVEAKGGSATELYTLNGEKFYTYN